MSALSAPYMHDEAAAFAHVEAMLWPDGPICPKCGVIGEAYELKGVRTKPSKKNAEGKVRHGLKKCKACGKQFTVRIGTIFENSHIELYLWLQAIHLMTSSKKGISSHQLSRTLGITVKSAWFMSRRIREAMRDDGAVDFGSGGGVVEVDETFIGPQQGNSEPGSFPVPLLSARGLVGEERQNPLTARSDGQLGLRRLVRGNRLCQRRHPRLGDSSTSQDAKPAKGT